MNKKVSVWEISVIFFFLSFLCAYSQTNDLEGKSINVIEELDVRVPMRDGVRLSTNIYRPDSPGTFPVLLTRSPYGNGGAGNFFATDTTIMKAEQVIYHSPEYPSAIVLPVIRR